MASRHHRPSHCLCMPGTATGAWILANAGTGIEDAPWQAWRLRCARCGRTAADEGAVVFTNEGEDAPRFRLQSPDWMENPALRALAGAGQLRWTTIGRTGLFAPDADIQAGWVELIAVRRASAWDAAAARLFLSGGSGEGDSKVSFYRRLIDSMKCQAMPGTWGTLHDEEMVLTDDVGGFGGGPVRKLFGTWCVATRTPDTVPCRQDLDFALHTLCSALTPAGFYARAALGDLDDGGPAGVLRRNRAYSLELEIGLQSPVSWGDARQEARPFHVEVYTDSMRVSPGPTCDLELPAGQRSHRLRFIVSPLDPGLHRIYVDVANGDYLLQSIPLAVSVGA